MEKTWFYFDMGPNGGVSGNSFAGPYQSRRAAEDNAKLRFTKTNVTEIAIVELVAVAERMSPPVQITEIKAAEEPSEVRHAA